jgi:hypothetical protein
MHVVSSYPQYLLEASQRYYSYPPYYWYNGGWARATPYLFIDGAKGAVVDSCFQYAKWRSKINARLSKASPFTCRTWGNYALTDGSGTIYARFRNDSTATITGRIRFVITEDSIYYAGPNGDAWHNHVARDYVPDTSGTAFTLAPGDSVTTSRSFTIQPAWNQNRCKIIAWVQNPTLSADSNRVVWQSGIQNVMDLYVNVDEQDQLSIRPSILATPNPCVGRTELRFTLYRDMPYAIGIYDALGRKVRSFPGIARGENESVTWNANRDDGTKVNPGVYFYRIESKRLKTGGKIIVN